MAVEQVRLYLGHPKVYFGTIVVGSWGGGGGGSGGGGGGGGGGRVFCSWLFHQRPSSRSAENVSEGDNKTQLERT